MNLIKRSFEIEVRAKDRRLTGIAVPFGQEAQIGRFREVILPGAFKRSLASGRDILALVDHAPSNVLGRTRSGTLRLEENRQGLAFELDVPDTQLGRDVLALAERRDVGGMSFGFQVPEGGESWSGERRQLRDVDLFEISVVLAFPAYEGTTVQARAAGSDQVRLAHARRHLQLLGGL